MSARGHKILVVEDDRTLADLTAAVLASEGFSASVLYSGEGAVEQVRASRPDLLILDLMLPGKDGFTICRECRAFYLGPVLMLTARDADVDQVLGLEFGADDYVIKPVVPRVLVARIRALLRRSARGSAAVDSHIDLGAVIIRPAERAVYVDHSPVVLTSAEYDLLYYLTERRGTVVERDELYRELRGVEYDGIDRSIDLRISRIRAALRKVAPSAQIIHTVHGRGYMIREMAQ
ncbi:MAG: response regulator transcription factor [Myxococcota bacterium]